MIIYKVTNITNNKVYIGKTEQDLTKRKRSHYDSVRNLDSQTNFHRALRSYPKTQFEWEIIHETDNSDLLNELEIHYINEYDSFKSGYNMTEGGDGGVTYKKGDELYERIKHKLGKWENGNPGSTKCAIDKRKETFKNTKWVSGKNHGNYGHKRNVGKFKGGDNPNAKSVIIHDVEYPTLVSASNTLNISEGILRYRCKSKNEKYKQYNYKN